MKKNFIKSLGLLLIILSTSISAETALPSNEGTYQIYVHSIEAQKTEYKVGEKVVGTFTLSNLSRTPQSDIYYSISSGIYHPENLTIEGAYGVTEKVGPLYIKANAKDVIPFSYTLPKSVTGNVGIQIIATLKDGTLVGQGDINVMVEGVAKPTSYVVNPYLFISDYDKAITPEMGPTIYPGESLTFNYSLAPTAKKYTVVPVLNIYDRVDNADALKRTIKLDPIVTDDRDPKTKGFKPIIHTVSLPTDLDPLVYFGVISFESEEVDISSVPARYIIAGPIATVRNITTENLEVKAGDSIAAVVTYGGQPLDEFRPAKQLVASSTILTVTATNEKNEVVGTVSQPLDLTKQSRNVTVSIKAGVAAKSLSFTSTIKTTDGKLLDEYAAKLPSAEDVKGQLAYGTQSDLFKPTVAVTLIIILVLIILFIIINKKYNKVSSISVSLFGLVMIIGISIFGMGNPVSADPITDEAQDYLNTITGWQSGILQYMMGWKVVDANNANGSPSPYFFVTSVSSPLPPWLAIYEPGQQFRLTFNATYADCNNAGRHYWAYAYDPSIAWQNQTPVFGNGDSSSAFDARVAYWDGKVAAGKAVKLLDWNNGDTWDELWLKSDLKAITIASGVNNGAGISAARESALKNLGRKLTVDTYCSEYGSRGICTGTALRMPLYAFDDASDYDYDIRDYLNWGRNYGSRANAVKLILKDANAIPAALAAFDFEDVKNLKTNADCKDYARGFQVCTYSAANEYTSTYVSKLKQLKAENKSFAQNTLNVFYDWFSLGEHARELLPVSLTKTYTAPTTPGYHKMFFYLYQAGDTGKRDFTIRQIICVRGSGKCPNEIDASRPIVNITGVDGVTATSSNLHWTYADKEKQTQKDYEIQLTTVQGNFTDLTKMKTFGVDSTQVDASKILNHVMTGLAPSTKYYVRMRSKENSPLGYWSLWTNGAYTFSTSNAGVGTCSCTGRSYVCKDAGGVTTSTTASSPYCALGSSCIASADNTNTTFTVAPQNAIGNVTYTRGANPIVTKGPSETYTYTTAKTSGIQSISVILKDLSDNQTTTATCSINNPVVPPTGQSCSCDSGGNLVCVDNATGAVQSTAPDSSCTVATSTPDVTITKTPSVVLNKGGSCTISWQLKDIPSGATCTLSGWGVNPPSNVKNITGDSSQKIDKLVSNQKYVISCSGGSMTPITKSVICRVNPDVIEN